jgi:hypothetical protein
MLYLPNFIPASAEIKLPNRGKTKAKQEFFLKNLHYLTNVLYFCPAYLLK